jgi:hypothetical protein
MLFINFWIFNVCNHIERRTRIPETGEYKSHLTHQISWLLQSRLNIEAKQWRKGIVKLIFFGKDRIGADIYILLKLLLFQLALSLPFFAKNWIHNSKI